MSELHDEVINKLIKDVRQEAFDEAIDAVSKVKPVSEDLHQSTNDLYYLHDIKQAINKALGGSDDT